MYAASCWYSEEVDLGESTGATAMRSDVPFPPGFSVAWGDGSGRAKSMRALLPPQPAPASAAMPNRSAATATRRAQRRLPLRRGAQGADTRNQTGPKADPSNPGSNVHHQVSTIVRDAARSRIRDLV